MSTVVTSKNWFQRMGEAIGGILFGIILLLVSIGVLWWNEGRSVHTAQALSEGQGKVVTVSSDAAASENNGKLIHTTGQATTDETLTDTELEVETTGNLQLRRKVEMFQWVEKKKSETRKKLGGGEETVTTYTYEKKWTDEKENSSNFNDKAGHENPAMPYSSQTFVAENAHLGAFQLGKLTDQVNDFSAYPVENEDFSAGSQTVSYHDISNPKIGDTRISYSVVKPTEVSVLAVQSNVTLEPYTAKSGDTLYRLMVGKKTSGEMFKQMVSENNMMTWILRFVGWLCMFIGISLLFRPLSVMVDILPFLGNIVEMGTGLVAFLLASSLSLVVIAIAWIAYRPVLGIGMLVVAGGLAFMLLRKKK